ncbi:MAG: hypothetical protein IJ153_07205 [Clostridia bacterium]|nr:hypothetical protein [Clostridia bacterium]
MADIDTALQASLLRDAVQSVLYDSLIIICGAVSTSPDYAADVNELIQLLRYRILDGENWTGFSEVMEKKRINASVPDAICRALLDTVYEQDALGLE